MNTSTEAVKLLQDALTKTQSAAQTINNLTVEHEYQDIAALLAQAGAALIESSTLLMQSNDEAAIEALERADDLLDTVYAIIDAEMDDEDE